MTSTQHNMPNLQFLFQLNLKHKVGVDVSASTADLRDKTTGYGRQVMPVTGGQCIGPNINAKILEHGAADWLINGPNGPKLNIRLTLKTEDNEFIYVTYDGFVGKNTNGMLVTFPRFETNAEKYIYLIDTPCVAIGKGGDGVRYDVYAVKPVPKL